MPAYDITLVVFKRRFKFDSFFFFFYRAYLVHQLSPHLINSVGFCGKTRTASIISLLTVLQSVKNMHFFHVYQRPLQSFKLIIQHTSNRIEPQSISACIKGRRHLAMQKMGPRLIRLASYAHAGTPAEPWSQQGLMNYSVFLSQSW